MTPNSAMLEPYELRCDGAMDPLGIDARPPRLSWKLRSTIRNTRQGAWQVLVASTRELIASDRGDVWDSGRVAGDDELRLPYAGRPLHSAEQVFWKVRAWGADGRASNWSEPATWTMGLLTPEEWAGHWITDAGLLKWQRPRIGFSSQVTFDETATKWVQIDLGAPCAIESVRLHGMTHTVLELLGFPKLFKVEAADNPGFRDAKPIADYSAKPFGNPWAIMIELPAAGVMARYVRVTVTKLRMVKEDGQGGHDTGRFALSQFEVLCGGKNIAVGATVTASDSIEEAPWSSAALVDGLGVPASNPRGNSTLRLRREFTVRPRLRRALAFVSGLGHYTLTVNGSLVDEDLLAPGWTAYEKSCLYDTRDLTALLAPGANAIGLTLASGMYSVQQGLGRYMKFVIP